MSLILAPPIQVLKKKCSLTFPLYTSAVWWYFFFHQNPKLTLHAKKVESHQWSRGVLHLAKPRAGTVPLCRWLQKRWLLRWKRPRLLVFRWFDLFVVCCVQLIFSLRKKHNSDFFSGSCRNQAPNPWENQCVLPKRIHQGASCFSKTLYSGFILEEYLRFNQKKIQTDQKEKIFCCRHIYVISRGKYAAPWNPMKCPMVWIFLSRLHISMVAIIWLAKHFSHLMDG